MVLESSVEVQSTVSVQDCRFKILDIDRNIVAYILFASLQVYIWVCLFLWPFLPIAFIVDSRVSEPTSLDALRFGIIMLVSTTITILQSVAFFSVVSAQGYQSNLIAS